MDFSPKQLPSNLEAEQAVLAAILMNNRALERVSEFLLADHFTHPAHKEIYRLIERKFAAGFQSDVVTVKDYLTQQGVLESVGGEDYLRELAAAGASVVNVEEYGRVIYDNAMRRELIALGKDIAESAYVEDLEKPIATQIELAEQKLFELASTGEAERGAIDMAATMRRALEEAEVAYKADGKLSGLTTGLRDLDKSTSGLHKSDLIIIAGRPAMGKTALAINIAFNAAQSVKNGSANPNYRGVVLFFSLEMSASQLGTRILSSQAKVPGEMIRHGSTTDTDMMKLSQSANYLATYPLMFDDTPGMSVATMRARARRIKRKHGLSMIVIDYLQLMTPPGGRKNDNRVNEVSEITRGLKMLAKDLEVPVIALSQLSRGVESRDDKRPQLSDLRDSGSIEQDADIVMFTYREEYYLDNRDPSKRINDHNDLHNQSKTENWEQRLEKSRGKAELIIGKNRHGKPGMVPLEFQGEFSLFTDARPGTYDARDEVRTSQPVSSATQVRQSDEPDVSQIPDDIAD